MSEKVDLGYYDEHEEPEPLEFATVPATTWKTIRGEDGKPKRVPDRNVYLVERIDVAEDDDIFNPGRKRHRVTWETVNEITVDGRSFKAKIGDDLRYSEAPAAAEARIREEVADDRTIPESKKDKVIKNRLAGVRLDAAKTRSLAKALGGPPTIVCDPTSGRIQVAVAVGYRKKDAEKRWPQAIHYYPADMANV